MKLRIKGNSIRLRLTKTEVEAFRKEGRIVESINFGGQAEPKLFYVLEKGSTPHLQASFDDGKITVSVPDDVAGQWVESEQVGFTGIDGSLQILVEKDFACLNPRAGEDESDNFPHPNTEELC